MLRGQDDAAAHLRLRNVGQDAGKVNNEVAARVGDDGEVGIFTLCKSLGQLYLEALLGFVLIVVHGVMG